MEKKETPISREKEAEEDNIWIMDLGVKGTDYEDVGDRIVTALDQLCSIKDVRCLYIKKEGNHLTVGKAETNCIE